MAAVGDDEPVPLLERPWLQRIQQRPDPRRVIELCLANGREIVRRVAPLVRVLRGAVGTDPDLAAQWETNQQQTRTAYGFLVQLLADRDALRPGLDVVEAGDIVSSWPTSRPTCSSPTSAAGRRTSGSSEPRTSSARLR